MTCPVCGYTKSLYGYYTSGTSPPDFGAVVMYKYNGRTYTTRIVCPQCRHGEGDEESKEDE